MPAQPLAGRSGGSRLAGIDGLRAAAALWVVLFHVHAFSAVTISAVPGLDLFLRSGSIGVSLFLVLSGFCLYVPFAGERIGRFQTGSFLRRRCKRLLPAYYASLVFALLLSLVAGSWLGFQHLDARQAAWQLFAHATLLHTLFPSTFFTLNGAYWSLGLEWQLYLALPLLIWAIRRYGLAPTATAAILCNVIYRLALAAAIGHGMLARDGAIALTVLPNQLPGRWAEFVFGMIAAELYVTGRIVRWAHRLKWTLLPLLPASLFLVGLPLSHLLFGAVFFIILSLVLASDNAVSKAFAWPPLVRLGVMSYSIYLVHEPVIQGLAYAIRAGGHTPAQTFLILMALLPMILGLAWILFVTVERRTLSGSHSVPTTAPDRRSLAAHISARRRGRQAQPVAVGAGGD